MRQQKPQIRTVKTVQISATSLPGGDFVRFAQDVVLVHLKLDNYRALDGRETILAHCISADGHECPRESWPDYTREVAEQIVNNLPALPITELIEPGATVRGCLVSEVAAALLGVGSEDIIEVEKQTRRLWVVNYLGEAEGQDGNAQG